MESLDVINQFLHDKYAAKMWKRTANFSRDGLISYIYTSVRDDTRKFKLVWKPSTGDVWVSDFLDELGTHITIFSEDISSILSTRYSLTFYFGTYSSISILYGIRRLS